jgi:lipopolysaccharide/colanic/teichoic acid biosynthesis glycosyltransferase
MYALAADGSAETNGPAFASKQDKRITRIGSILRKTRIDELPQAWNLLRGELSLIGPRPERPELIEILAKRFPAYPLRSMITPGITGWAAIQQEYASTLDEAEEKLLYDLYYIKHRSFSLDLIIIIRTIGTVLRMRGQ